MTAENRARARQLADRILRTGTVRVDDVVSTLANALDEAEARGYVAGEAAGRHDVELEARATGADGPDVDPADVRSDFYR